MKTQGLRNFWRIMRSISLTEVMEEASRQVTVAVVGDEDRQRELLRRLFPGRSPETALPLIRRYPGISKEDGFPQESGTYDIVLDAGGGWAPTEGPVNVYSMDDLGGWEGLASRVLDERPDVALALARRFPGFRDPVADRIIRETSLANAQFAMLNGLPALAPVTALLLPTTAVGDILIIGKNQALMLYRLAACYDLDLDPRSRAADLAPLVGNAFGWRALARQVTGLVPGGVGLIAKGAAAYAGTRALGEAMRRYYKLGEHPTRASVSALYRESLTEAREAASRLMRSVRAVRPPRGLLRGPEED